MSTHRLCASGIVSRYAAHLLLAGTCLVIGVLLLLLGIARPNSGTLLPGAIIAACALPWLIPMLLAGSRRPRMVELSEDGIAWADRNGEHRRRWAEVAAVYRSEKLVNQSFKVRDVWLVFDDGTKAAFDQCHSDYDRLADTLQNMTAERALAEQRAALHGAGAAEFGPVTLRPGGLDLRGKSFPWDELDQYTVFNGTLLVYPASYKGQNCEAVALGEIPNYLALLTLLEELGQSPVPPEQSILFVGRTARRVR